MLVAVLLSSAPESAEIGAAHAAQKTYADHRQRKASGVHYPGEDDYPGFRSRGLQLQAPLAASTTHGLADA